MNIIRFIILFSIVNLSVFAQGNDIKELNKLIDNWHKDAAVGDFDSYFDKTHSDFIFLGTDPQERWNRKEFMAFCKPYFNKGKAWEFKALKRDWVVKKRAKVIWFDETLDTWMNTCRGSGILIKRKGKWKLIYYNLTVLIENDKIQKFIDLRKQ